MLTCMATSSRTKKGTGPVFKFFRCSIDLTTQKVYVLRFMLVYVGIIMLAACTWSRFPCFLLVSWVWDISSDTAPTALSAIQASSQSTFINEQLYNPLVVSRKDKKQLTVLSQRKLTLTAINKLFVL